LSFEILTRETVKFTAKGHGYYRVLVEGEEVSKHTTEREALESATNHYEEGLDVRVIHDYEVQVVKNTQGKIVRVRVKTQKLKLNTPMAIVSYTSPGIGQTNPDSVPAAFFFTTQTNVALATTVTSNWITVEDTTIPSTISISGANNPEYQIEGEVTWRQAAYTVSPGKRVRVRHESSAFNSQSIVTTLDIQGVMGTFTSKTEGVLGDWQIDPAYRMPARIPMQLIYPFDDATTSDDARHKWAHSGFEYQIPIGIQGGEWPYRYELTSAPSGMFIGETMDIDSNGIHTSGEYYGIIRWPNPSGTHTVTGRATDQAGTIVTFQFTVTTDNNKFTFIQDGASAGGSGTISSPLEDWDDWYKGDSSDSSFQDQIIVFRGGNYTAVGDPSDPLSSDGVQAKLRNSKTHSLIGYPGETPVISMLNCVITIVSGNGEDSFFAGIKWSDSNPAMGNSRMFHFASGHSRSTWWKNTFDHVVGGTRGISNTCAVWSDHVGGASDYLMWKQNTYTNFDNKTSNGAFIDNYNSDYILVEKEYAPSSNKTSYGWWAKATRNYVCVRDCHIENTNGRSYALQMGQEGSEPNRHEYYDICYNLGIQGVSQALGNLNVGQSHDSDLDESLNVYCYRNTFQGGKVLCKDASDLPNPDIHNLDGNVCISDHATPYGESDAIQSLFRPDIVEGFSSGVTDTDTGKLTGTWRDSYLGLYGHEIWSPPK
jgi:hypothetical protein